jgi:opacity protein-like surface antigen
MEARGAVQVGEHAKSMKGISMKIIKLMVLVSVGCLVWSAVAEDGTSLDKRWRVNFDIGGTFSESATLSEFGGRVTGGGDLKLSPGMQVDLAAGYRFTPWLSLEGEFGFTYNSVDSVGNWSYPSSSLSQMLMMINVVVEYPRGPFVPFAGFGAGGVFSSLTFGNYYDFYGSYYDGEGTDFVPALQAFGGVRYDFNKQWSLGVIYRFLATDNQQWNVDWCDGSSFPIGVNRVCIQSICLQLTASF